MAAAASNAGIEEKRPRITLGAKMSDSQRFPVAAHVLAYLAPSDLMAGVA